jgi:PAS domain S-box-containing protein
MSAAQPESVTVRWPGSFEQHLAAIVENSDDAIVSKNLEGRILYWNDAATRMYGYTAEEATGQPIEIVIPEDLERRQEELDIRTRIGQGQRFMHYETIRRHKDGTELEVSLSISPVRDASGRVVAAAGFARDISDRRVIESAQYLAAIVENSDDAIVSIDRDGKILSWNAAATRMYGYPEDEAVGRPIDIVIPDDPERRQKELDIRARIACGERIEHYETERRRKDGTQFPVSLSISPVRDTFDRIVAAASSARDISQRRLLESAQYLAAIVENSDDAIVSKDLEGRILSWNDAATRMYGYTAEEAIGRPIDIVIPDDPKRRQEELDIRARIARGERIEHYETERRRRDSTRFPVSLSISPVRDASGRIVAAAGFARDISEQRRAIQSTQYLAAIVDNSDDAIVSKDLEGRIQSWNDAATRMYGYTAEEAIGRPIDIVIPGDPERRQEELDIRARIAQGERIEHYETERRRKDGTRFPVSLSISPVRDASGRIVAAAGFARDISERKRLEAERRRATGFLTSFANFSAHDFKTPMQHILWDSQAALMSLDASDPAEVRRKLERITTTSRWMQTRTDGLLVAAGLNQGKHPPREQVSSQQAFDEAHRTLAEEDQLVQRATVTNDPLPEVVSNEVLLGFLFRNLLENACKYGRVGVPVMVHVSAERIDHSWQFSIADNGRGVPHDKLEAIFEAGVRGENVSSDEPGSGIGLHFCSTIISWHQGRIWAESGPAPGATFKFTIPDLRAGNG